MRLGDFVIKSFITGTTAVDSKSSNPHAACYIAPELLDPKQFNLDHHNPSKESDVFSLALTAYEVLSSYLVVCVTHIRPLPTARFSRMSFRMKGRRVR